MGEEDAKGTANSVWDGVAGVWAWFTMVRQGLDAWAQDGLALIEASWVRHRCLLGSTGAPTLTKEVSSGNLESLTKPKLALLVSLDYLLKILFERSGSRVETDSHIIYWVNTAGLPVPYHRLLTAVVEGLVQWTCGLKANRFVYASKQCLPDEVLCMRRANVHF